MVRTFLKVYMELGSYFLFLQEQMKDIIIIGVDIPPQCDFHPKDHVQQDIRPTIILFRNGELNLLWPGSGCPLQAGTGHGRPGRAPGRCGCAVTSLLQRDC
jgi:hypothetical protein